MQKTVLITGSDATLKVDAETGFVWEKISHQGEHRCGIDDPITTPSTKSSSHCSCSYMGHTELNTAYADIRRFNLNDRTRNFIAGEIVILYIGYEKWDGTYERPLTEFAGVNSEGFIATDALIRGSDEKVTGRDVIDALGDV